MWPAAAGVIAMPYVDVHGHFAPYGEHGGGPPSLRDPEGVIEAKREAGIALTIIGAPVGPGSMLPWESAGNYRQPAGKVRAHNEAMADLVSRFPAALRAYAYLNPLAGPEMVAQAAELIAEWQFVGFIVNSSIDGQYLDDPRAEDFFAMAAEAGAPILLHPPAAPPGAAGFRQLGLIEHVARGCDVTAGTAAIVCGGWLERFPGLRLIAAAGGGGLATLAEKLDLAMAGPAGPPGAVTSQRLSAPPSYSLRRVLVELSCPSRIQLRANLQAFGPGNILFGTDAPPLMTEVTRAVQLIEEENLTAAARSDIRWGNAVRLFGLSLTAAAGSKGS
jgi:predicted TIM-barrel fold metal-dependent hydrolase